MKRPLSSSGIKEEEEEEEQHNNKKLNVDYFLNNNNQIDLGGGISGGNFSGGIYGNYLAGGNMQRELLAGEENMLSEMSTASSSEVLEENGLNGTSSENNNENAKKVKLNNGSSSNNGDDMLQENNTKPSRVVHIRNIPSDVTETEIVHLGIPFGRVSNVLVLKGKNQAFLELADESAAIAMVSYFTNCVAQLRGRSVYVQFSTHKELKTDQSHSNANSAAQAALQAAQALVVNSGGVLNASSSSPVADTQGGPNTVLRVIIEQMLYPVTLDVLYQIFSRVGKVLRIVTFTKNGFFQALIQYPDVVMAQAAKLTLDGQNIYNGCCTLRIEYSKLSSLNVRYNNDKSRDYTNPNLPTGEPNNSIIGNQSNEMAALFGLNQQQQNNGGVLGHFGTNQQIMNALGNSTGQGGNSNSAAAAAAVAAAQSGFLAAMQLAANPMGHHHHPGQHPLQRHHHQQQMQHQMGGHHPHHHPHHHHQLGLNSAGILAAVQASISGGGNNMPGCVLLVSNLNEESITPDGLFTLFGVYGDVTRCKILFNKKDSALVQMREPAQAQLALTYLDRLKLHGKIIRVTLSKHGLVQMPKEGQPDAGLTKDYSSNALHRFKKPDSKNYQNIYPPSATLHLSNIPASVSEEEILEAFKIFNTKGFKFFPKDRKMALLQLGSIEEASEALIKMHNYQLRENSHLRVSFSKSTI